MRLDQLYAGLDGLRKEAAEDNFAAFKDGCNEGFLAGYARAEADFKKLRVPAAETMVCQTTYVVAA